MVPITAEIPVATEFNPGGKEERVMKCLSGMKGNFHVPF